jgi:hypothetical protein
VLMCAGVACVYLIGPFCKNFQPKSARIQSTPFLVLMASVSSFGVSEHHISAPWTILNPLGPENVALSPFFLFFPKKGSENLYKYVSWVSVDEMVSICLCWFVFYSSPGFYFNLPSKKFHKMAFDANMQMRLGFFFCHHLSL